MLCNDGTNTVNICVLILERHINTIGLLKLRLDIFGKRLSAPQTGRNCIYPHVFQTEFLFHISHTLFFFVFLLDFHSKFPKLGRSLRDDYVGWMLLPVTSSCPFWRYDCCRSPYSDKWQDAVRKMCCAVTDGSSCTFKERVHAERTTFFSDTG